MLVLGIMSGTSLDGVDYALCEIGQRELALREGWAIRFPARLRERLHDAARGRARSWEIAQLHHDLGRFYADGAGRGKSRRRPQLIGLHGQTIFHHPDARRPATFQLGEPAYLAMGSGVPVISNFRAADLAAGGEGAPLATLFHARVFARPGRHVCVHNLGGISNVTSLDGRRRGPPQVLAFDTGPANVLLDLAMRQLTDGQRSLDRNGAWAARGRPDSALVRDWLRHRFFRRPPPKSTGRELFGEPFLQRALPQMLRARLSREDILATLTEFTARSISLNYQLHLHGPPGSVVLTGGGAANPSLVSRIGEALRTLNPRVELGTSEDYGWPLASIEPAAFALLAWLRLHRRAGHLPQTTGARRAVLLGQVTEIGG